MKIVAFIQMGEERRETVIKLPHDHWKQFKEEARDNGSGLEAAIEGDLVRGWIEEQLTYGWQVEETEPAKIRAFIEIGTERRETLIEMSQDWKAFKENCRQNNLDFEEAFEYELLRDWMMVQYGYGWKGAGYEMDFSFLEGSSDGSLVATKESSIPNTVRVRRCPDCNERISPGS